MDNKEPFFIIFLLLEDMKYDAILAEVRFLLYQNKIVTSFINSQHTWGKKFPFFSFHPFINRNRLIKSSKITEGEGEREREREREIIHRKLITFTSKLECNKRGKIIKHQTLGQFYLLDLHYYLTSKFSPHFTSF